MMFVMAVWVLSAVAMDGIDITQLILDKIKKTEEKEVALVENDNISVFDFTS